MYAHQYSPVSLFLGNSYLHSPVAVIMIEMLSCTVLYTNLVPSSSLALKRTLLMRSEEKLNLQSKHEFM